MGSRRSGRARAKARRIGRGRVRRAGRVRSVRPESGDGGSGSEPAALWFGGGGWGLPPLPGRFCVGMLDRRLTPPANFR